MPIYEYKCPTCGNHFERLQQFSDDPETDCPQCHHMVHRLLGKPAITTVAWTDPSTYLRVIASLVPKDIEVTGTNDHLERMTTPQLEARLRALEAEDGAEILRTRRCGF